MSAPPSDEAFARYASQAGLATADQLDEARELQSDAQKKGQLLSLADALVLQGAITAAQKEIAEKKLQAQQAGGIKSLGNYKLLKKLGEGGMGAVYLAEDTNMLRKVALKVLPKKYAADPEFLTRFRREAKAAGKLNHVNIVSAFTVGEELGNHYYVMEYCEGEPLDKILKREGTLPWDKAVEITMQIARGLQHAHQHDFIHRDIKPANVFVASHATSTMGRGSLNGVAKILDMGLSKNISDSDQSFNTQTGMALGTPHYISPEQARGEKNVDGRTDIYSLGATLYHLLTGQTPFTGSTAAMIIMKHLTDQIPNPQDIREDIPDGVVMVIQKMMAKDAADRYADCLALLEDLELVLDGKTPSSVDFDAGKSSVAMKQVKRIASNEAADRMRRGRTGKQAPVEDSRGGDRRQADRRSEPRGPNPNNKIYIAAGVAAMGVLVFLLALTKGGPAKGEPAKPEAATVAKIDDQPSLPQPAAQTIGTQAKNETLLPGLAATYYAGTELEKGRRVLQRVDAIVDFAWETGSPAPEVPTDKFSARWDGFLMVKKPGRYIFNTLSDDGLRLFVDRKLLIDAWRAGDYSRQVAEMDLPAGLHAITLEYFEDTGGAYCHLAWSLKDGFPEQVIPAYNLFHTPEQERRVVAGVDDAWITSVRKMTPEKQIDAVVAKLAELNPGFDAEVTPTVENNTVTRLMISRRGKNVSNISPVAALKELKSLRLNYLRGVEDLSALKGLGLTDLAVYGTPLSNLTPLRGMQLAEFACFETNVADLSPLQGMPLTKIHMSKTPVRDLSPLAGMRLTLLHCDISSITDLSPLKGMPLKDLTCDFVPARDAAILKSITSLEKINTLPAAEFWAKNAVPEVAPNSGTWISKDATYTVSSMAPDAGGKPKPSLLSGVGGGYTGYGGVDHDWEFTFHTREEPNPNIVIDLGKSFAIDSLEIVNRKGDPKLQERAKSLTAYSASSGSGPWDEFWRADAAKAEWLARPAKPTEARFIKLELRATGILHLCSVKVYGKPVLAVDDPARWAKAIDLLKLADPNQDSKNGRWSLNAGALNSDAVGFARLELPYHPPEEYDFRIDFTPNGNPDVNQMLTRLGNTFHFMPAGNGNQLTGFALVNGQFQNASTTQKRPCLNSGQRYSSIVQVRNDGLKAFIDGKLISELKTDYRNLSCLPQARMTDKSALGVLSHQCPTVFHTIQVLEVKGKGEFLRPNDAAEKTEAKKQ